MIIADKAARCRFSLRRSTQEDQSQEEIKIKTLEESEALNLQLQKTFMFAPSKININPYTKCLFTSHLITEYNMPGFQQKLTGDSKRQGKNLSEDIKEASEAASDMTKILELIERIFKITTINN